MMCVWHLSLLDMLIYLDVSQKWPDSPSHQAASPSGLGKGTRMRCRYQAKRFSAWSPAGPRGQYKLTRIAARITYGYAGSLEILGAEPI
jgi:hypothetical protein